MTALRSTVRTPDDALWAANNDRDANQHVRALVMAQHVARKNAESRTAVERARKGSAR